MMAYRNGVHTMIQQGVRYTPYDAAVLLYHIYIYISRERYKDTCVTTVHSIFPSKTTTTMLLLNGGLLQELVLYHTAATACCGSLPV